MINDCFVLCFVITSAVAPGNGGLSLMLYFTFYGSPCAGVFVSLFGLAYIISARFCHRFVGYLEEEAVSTYTHCIKVATAS